MAEENFGTGSSVGGGSEINGRLASMDSVESRWVFQDDDDSVMDDDDEDEEDDGALHRTAMDSEDDDDNAEQRLIRTGPRIDSFDVEALEIPGAQRNDYEVCVLHCPFLCRFMCFLDSFEQLAFELWLRLPACDESEWLGAYRFGFVRVVVIQFTESIIQVSKWQLLVTFFIKFEPYVGSRATKKIHQSSTDYLIVSWLEFWVDYI